MFTLYQLTRLVHSICLFNSSLGYVFTSNNGIEIALSIFNFPLPASPRETVIGFVRPFISNLWGGANGDKILCNCSIHELMTLLLWAVNNEGKDNEGSMCVGKNAIRVLLMYADEVTKDRGMSEKQELLLKFGIPRLLVLFGDILSYGKYMKLECPTNRTEYCKDIVTIIYRLAQNLVRLAVGSQL